MLLDIVAKDTTDYSCILRIVDSTDGTPETGVVYNTAGIDLWYRRPGAVHTSITEATQTENGAHSDGGFVHISDGYYRLDLPDAAVATGVDFVDVGGTVTGMVVIGGRIRLTDVDLSDGVRAGLTALPNAAADAAGGLPISDAGGLDLDAMNTNINDIETDTNALQIDLTDGGRLDLLIDAIKAVTDNLPNSGALTDLATAASITALNDISTADVNAQVADVLKTDTVTEMSQGAPPASPTMQQILNYLYRELVRNKVVVDTNTLNQKQVFADDGTTVLYEKNLTNASSITTVAEATTGA
jgi:hypothetical protein